MKCQRCLTDREAQYRAYTDLMELNICASCAEEAHRLGISLAVLVYDDPPPHLTDCVENAKSNSSKRERRH
jgi:hypothetical protein